MNIVIPVVAGASTLLAGGAALYKVLRPPESVTVNCWFCNENTVVPAGNKTCWDCPHCDQYNGFAIDGDYNKAIPAQYNENLNHPVTRINRPKPPAPSAGSENTGQQLCDTCIRNQLLKVKQLANFVPYNELMYDFEVDVYSQHLENVYRLCDRCRVKVQQELHAQDVKHGLSKLVQERNLTQCSDDEEEEDREASFWQPVEITSPRPVQVLRHVSSVFALLLFFGLIEVICWGEKLTLPYMPTPAMLNTTGLVILGLFSSITAVLIAGSHSVSLLDAGSCVTWLLLLLLETDASSLIPVSTSPIPAHKGTIGSLYQCDISVLWCSETIQATAPEDHQNIQKTMAATQ